MNQRILRPVAAALVAIGMGIAVPRVHAGTTATTSTQTSSIDLLGWLSAAQKAALEFFQALSCTGESGSNLVGESGSNVSTSGSTGTLTGESGSN